MLKRLALIVFLSASVLPATAQDRNAELNKAFQETRAAQHALQEAQQRRDKGVEPLEGERVGTADGGSRTSEAYKERQARLAREVELARQRYEAAQKRWGDVK